MKFYPEFDKVKELADAGTFKVVPVSCEILSDFTTPIEAVRVLKNVSSHCYMLESAQANETWGRYTFLGFDPAMEITCTDGQLSYTIGGETRTAQTQNPSAFLRSVLSQYKSPRFSCLPPFARTAVRRCLRRERSPSGFGV